MKLALIAAAATVLAAAPIAGPASATAHHGRATASSATARQGSARHSLVLHDGAGDVWLSTSDLGYEASPKPVVDVLKASIHHGTYAVRVRMAFDDLRRTEYQSYYCDIATASGTSQFLVSAGPGDWRGTATQLVHNRWVEVPGLTHRIDFAKNVVTLRVARTLLGRPAWVRVQLWNTLGGPGSAAFWTDNPENSSYQPAFTPRL